MKKMNVNKPSSERNASFRKYMLSISMMFAALFWSSAAWAAPVYVGLGVNLQSSSSASFVADDVVGLQVPDGTYTSAYKMGDGVNIPGSSTSFISLTASSGSGNTPLTGRTYNVPYWSIADAAEGFSIAEPSGYNIVSVTVIAANPGNGTGTRPIALTPYVGTTKGSTTSKNVQGWNQSVANTSVTWEIAENVSSVRIGISTTSTAAFFGVIVGLEAIDCSEVITYTKQPTEKGCNQGNSTGVTATSSLSSTISYKWEVSDDGSTGWTTITQRADATATDYGYDAVTGATLVIYPASGAVANSGKYYRSVATGSCASLPSNPVKFTVEDPLSPFVVHNSGDTTEDTENTGGTACATSISDDGKFPVALIATGGEGNYTYQWKASADRTTINPTSDKSVGTSDDNSYTPRATTEFLGANYYYALVSNSCNRAVISNVSKAYTVNKPAFLAVTELQGTGGIICEGAEATFSLVGGVTGASYQIIDTSDGNKVIAGPVKFTGLSVDPLVIKVTVPDDAAELNGNGIHVCKFQSVEQDGFCGEILDKAITYTVKNSPSVAALTLTAVDAVGGNETNKINGNYAYCGSGGSLTNSAKGEIYLKLEGAEISLYDYAMTDITGGSPAAPTTIDGTTLYWRKSGMTGQSVTYYATVTPKDGSTCAAETNKLLVLNSVPRGMTADVTGSSIIDLNAIDLHLYATDGIRYNYNGSIYDGVSLSAEMAELNHTTLNVEGKSVGLTATLATNSDIIGATTGLWSISSHYHDNRYLNPCEMLPLDQQEGGNGFDYQWLCHFYPYNSGEFVVPAQGTACGDPAFNNIIQTSSNQNVRFYSLLPSTHIIQWTVTAQDGCAITIPLSQVEVTENRDRDRAYFRTKANGNWLDSKIWEISESETGSWVDAYSGNDAVPANIYPSGSAVKIIVSHVVDYVTSQTLPDVVIENGGQLILRDGSFSTTDGNYTETSGTANITIDAGKVFTVKSGGKMINQIQNRQVTQAGSFVFESGSQYRLESTPSGNTARTDIIPNAIWNVGSEMVLALNLSYGGAEGGNSYYGLYGVNQAFDNFVVDMPTTSHNVVVIPRNSGFIRTKNMTVKSTGEANHTKAFIQFTNDGEGSTDTRISGNYVQTGGQATLVAATSKYINRSFTVEGDFTMSGASKFAMLDYDEAPTTAGVCYLDIYGNMTISGSTACIYKATPDYGAARIRFSNGTTKKVSRIALGTEVPAAISGSFIRNATTYPAIAGRLQNINMVSANNGKTLNLASEEFTGGPLAAFGVGSYATVQTSHPDGFDGGNMSKAPTTWVIAGNEPYTPNWEFNGTVAQKIVNNSKIKGFHINRLIINNVAGVILVDKDGDPTTVGYTMAVDTLTLTSGNLTVNRTNFFIDKGVIQGSDFSVSKHIITNGEEAGTGNGRIILNMPATVSTMSLPIGKDAADYALLTFNKAAEVAGSFEVKAIAENFGANALSKSQWHIDGNETPFDVTVAWNASTLKNPASVPDEAAISYYSGASAGNPGGTWTLWTNATQSSRATTAHQLNSYTLYNAIVLGGGVNWYRSVPSYGSNFENDIWEVSTDKGQTWSGRTYVPTKESLGAAGSVEKVIINNNHTVKLIAGNYQIKTLRIEPTATLLSQTGNLSVTDSLTIKATYNSVGQVLNTDYETQGSGQFSCTGIARLEKTMVKQRWEFFTSPFLLSRLRNAANGNLLTIAGNNYKIGYYDGDQRARTNLWDTNNGLNWVLMSALPSESEVAKHRGYEFASGGDRTVWFEGVANGNNESFKNTSISVPVYGYNYSAIPTDPSNANWNAIGNPYTSNFNLATLDPQYICYVYNPATKVYTTVAKGSSYTIKPYEAFFIQSMGGETVTFGGALQTRSLTEPEIKDQMTFTIFDANNSDEFHVVLSNKATTSYDINQDGLKLTLLTDQCQLYNTLNSQNMAITALPRQAKTIVPLYFIAPKAGDYTIAYNNKEIAPNVERLILRDKSTTPASEYDLLNNPEYTFRATTTGKNTSRFELEISLADDELPTFDENVGQNGNDATLQILVKGNNLVLKGLNAPAKVVVFDFLGRQVLSFKNVMDNQPLSVNLKGNYLIEVSTGGEVISKKVYFN